MKKLIIVSVLFIAMLMWVFSTEAQWWSRGSRGRGVGPGWQGDTDSRINYQIESRKNLTPEQIAQLPPGCRLGLANLTSRPGPRYGCGIGQGYGGGRGMGHGYGKGFGGGRGCCWW